jgi:hypothetical protein
MAPAGLLRLTGGTVMIRNAYTMDRLLYGVTRIEAETTDGDLALGTSFLYCHQPAEGSPVNLLITNNHVVEDTTTGRIEFHEFERTPTNHYKRSRNRLRLSISDFAKQWISHPNKDVDLCGMLIDKHITAQVSVPPYAYGIPYLKEYLLTQKEFEETQSVHSVTEVHMVGYPIGLWDEVNNFPIIRRGIAASSIGVNFDGRPEFLIDMACFPGSSGSPVVMTQGFMRRTEEFQTGYSPGLAGVLYAGPVMEAEGRIVRRKIPTRRKRVALTEVSIHLGYVIKAPEILVLADHIASQIGTSV